MRRVQLHRRLLKAKPAFQILSHNITCSSGIDDGMSMANESLVRRGNAPTQMQPRGAHLHQPQLVKYNRVINGLVNCKEVGKALAMLAQMETMGCTPDTITYSILIKGLLNVFEVNKALGLLTEMERRGYTPNIITYTSLINDLCNCKEVGKALTMLAHMEKRGCSPNVVTYNSLIKGLLNVHEVNTAVTMLTEMAKRGDAHPTCVPTTASSMAC
ncbi:hypothetical protein L7F22_020605 [Adiantum nelumboides]|nr:hypothetical protein [Adiantum nelumboides]